MTNQHDEFLQLMDEVRAGSAEAVDRLLERYGPYILTVVRRRLGRTLRSKFDSQDFQQSVWKSFFADLAMYDHLKHPGQLARLLAKIASGKVIDQQKRLLRTPSNRDHSERSLDVDGPHQAALAAGPTPSTVVSAREQLERLMNNSSALVSKMVRLRADGKTFEEIGRTVGVSERTVRRTFRKLSESALQ
ncbi:MAG: RNA polymerase sigma factor [Planctomycetaceae bacterium]